MAAVNIGWVKGEILNRPNGLYKLKVGIRKNLKLSIDLQDQKKVEGFRRKIVFQSVIFYFLLVGYLKSSKRLMDRLEIFKSSKGASNRFKLQKYVVWYIIKK